MKPGMIHAGVAVIILGTSFIACSGVLPRIKDNPECTTTIEGFLHSDQVPWLGPRPGIIVREYGDYKFWSGKIVETRDDGIIFDEDRISALADPDPTFIEYKDIIAVVDKDGKTSYGKVPGEFARTFGLEIQLQSMNDPDAKSFELEMKPNESFGYCATPGYYQVTRVRFFSKDNHVDEAINLPRLRLRVEKDASNYVGDLYLNCESMRECELGVSFIVIEESRSDDGSGILAGFLLAGVIGSAVGAGLEEAFDGTIPPYIGHEFAIKIDTAFMCRGRNPRINSPVVRLDDTSSD